MKRTGKLEEGRIGFKRHYQSEGQFNVDTSVWTFSGNYGADRVCVKRIYPILEILPVPLIFIEC